MNECVCVRACVPAFVRACVRVCARVRKRERETVYVGARVLALVLVLVLVLVPCQGEAVHALSVFCLSLAQWYRRWCLHPNHEAVLMDCPDPAT
eukprot:13588439-Alexandrium_andersonii.AAC.1